MGQLHLGLTSTYKNYLIKIDKAVYILSSTYILHSNAQSDIASRPAFETIDYKSQLVRVTNNVGVSKRQWLRLGMSITQMVVYLGLLTYTNELQVFVKSVT